jgi:hypothetical protein
MKIGGVAWAASAAKAEKQANGGENVGENGWQSASELSKAKKRNWRKRSSQRAANKSAKENSAWRIQPAAKRKKTWRS